MRNEEILVEVGETRFISSRSLLSTDQDTVDDQLLFIVKKLPDDGELILTRSGREDKIVRENEHFTQNDGKCSIKKGLNTGTNANPSEYEPDTVSTHAA